MCQPKNAYFLEIQKPYSELEVDLIISHGQTPSIHYAKKKLSVWHMMQDKRIAKNRYGFASGTTLQQLFPYKLLDNRPAWQVLFSRSQFKNYAKRGENFIRQHYWKRVSTLVDEHAEEIFANVAPPSIDQLVQVCLLL